MGPTGVGDGLFVAYRDLLGMEARLGEALSPRGIRVGVSVADQWPVLSEFLGLYARGLGPAGALVLGGGLDEGSRHTGIPFTGGAEARASLGLSVASDARSPSAAAFWRAVERARDVAAEGAPLESLFGTVHLAHAQPFDFEPAPEVREAAARHVARLLSEMRPQLVAAVGSDALAALGQAVGDVAIMDLARAPEASWASHYPAQTPMHRYPTTDVPAQRPFRVRVVPVPSLDGAHARQAEQALERVLAYAWV